MTLFKYKTFTIFLPLFLFLTACDQGQQFAIQEQSQIYDQAAVYNSKFDIVFLVDDSSSMKQHQDRLAVAVPAMVQKLLALKMDFHIAAINTNMGGNSTTGKPADGGTFIGSPKFLTSNTQNLASVVASRVKVGQDGSNNERGLESLEKVLSPPYINNEGAGFLRDDAILVIVALTDEQDNSVPPVGGGSKLQHYIDFLDRVKPPSPDGQANWVLNLIGTLSLNSTCISFNDSSSVSAPFLDLADYSGGIKTSICTTDLTGAIANIQKRLIGIITDYRLAKIPDVASIRVTINGVSIPRSSTNGWDYISSINSVRFYGTSIPGPDAAIKIDYTPANPN